MLLYLDLTDIKKTASQINAYTFGCTGANTALCTLAVWAVDNRASYLQSNVSLRMSNPNRGLSFEKEGVSEGEAV